ncbi:MAG TPA: twin-arginine translocase TatA/TatE family subunit [Polyangia bacterium]|jgi:twin arginine-targeting protein translocase, TatA/E family|nr:twin-arginine translocase TatA/TatE family subunit [Polyangia bacterium]
MFGLGASELVLILLVVVVVFGSTKLPQLGDGLGRAIKNFKRAVTSANEIEVSPKKGEMKGEIPGDQPKAASAQSSEPAAKP